MTETITKRDVDSRFDVDEKVEAELLVSNARIYDSLQNAGIRLHSCDVSAYAVISFDDGNDIMDYQFVVSTVFEDAEVVYAKSQCAICSSIGTPHFKCRRWVRYTLSYDDNTLCEDCLESFLEIRDKLLEECSGQIASEGL